MVHLTDFMRVGEKVKLHQQSLIKHTHDPNICVVKTLDEYISRTEGCRSTKEFSQLMQSFINPHEPLVSSTISAWLKKCADRRRN